jgi:hypothetical protein
LDTLGLDDALASFIREWSSQYAIKAQFHSNLTDIRSQRGRLSRTIETNFYRIAQEGLNSIMKHANAKNVSVLLQYRKDSLVLITEDDGSGLPEGYNFNAGKSNGSFGLIGMHESASLLKGTFEIESRPGGRDNPDHDRTVVQGLLECGRLTSSYLSEALSFSRTTLPGQSSDCGNEFSGRSAVFSMSCRSAESSWI